MFARIFVAALFLSTFASAFPEGFTHDIWLAVPALPESALRELIPMVDVRDTYKGTTLMVVNEIELNYVSGFISEYEMIGEYFKSSPLIIIDVPKDIKDAASVIEKAATQASVKVLMVNEHIAIIQVTSYARAYKFEEALPFPAEIIPVARRGISLPATLKDSPLASAINTAEKSDVVQRLVDSVKSENLYNVLNQLTNNFHTRNSLSKGAVEAQEWIARIYSSLGYSVSVLPYTNGISANVIAELRGAVEPEKYVIIGAHYDCRMSNTYDNSSRAPGADDDGSGTTAVLEIARALVDSGIRFRYSIRIASWSGEEQGLLGSSAYVKTLQTQKTNVVAYLNADMLGYKIPRKAITLGIKVPNTTPWLNDMIRSITSTYVPSLPTAVSNSCCSDYKPFFEAGYPASAFFENDESASSYPCYHNVCDTIDQVNLEQITLITKAMVATTATLAQPQ